MVVRRDVAFNEADFSQALRESPLLMIGLHGDSGAANIVDHILICFDILYNTFESVHSNITSMFGIEDLLALGWYD